jgi:hypothetical protein
MFVMGRRIWLLGTTITVVAVAAGAVRFPHYWV